MYCLVFTCKNWSAGFKVWHECYVDYSPELLTKRETCLSNVLVDANALEFSHHKQEVGVFKNVI